MFIKLTGHRNKSSIWVRLDTVLAMAMVPPDQHSGAYTELLVDTDKPAIGVLETPEQIMEMIENAKN